LEFDGHTLPTDLSQDLGRTDLDTFRDHPIE
jgi:hypothetical protein